MKEQLQYQLFLLDLKQEELNYLQGVKKWHLITAQLAKNTNKQFGLIVNLIVENAQKNWKQKELTRTKL